MKLKLIILFLMISFFGVSQKDKGPIMLYRSLDGLKVSICDSLSFQNRYLNSQFFIDSLSGEPFTGKVTRYMNSLASNPLDSLQVLNGVLNDIQKMYLFNNETEVELLSVKFLDVNAKTFISTTFNRSKTTHLKFYDYESHLREYVIRFKKNKIRVRLKRTLFTSEGIKKTRRYMKFKTYSDFKVYLKQFHIYDDFERMGVLEKEFVEPIIYISN